MRKTKSCYGVPPGTRNLKPTPPYQKTDEAYHPSNPTRPTAENGAGAGFANGDDWTGYLKGDQPPLLRH